MLPTRLETSRLQTSLSTFIVTFSITRCYREGHELGRSALVVRLRDDPFPDYPVLLGIVYGSTIPGQCIFSPAATESALVLSALSAKNKSTTNSMSDQSPPDRYKAEMPQIPGIPAGGSRLCSQQSDFAAGWRPSRSTVNRFFWGAMDAAPAAYRTTAR